MEKRWLTLHDVYNGAHISFAYDGRTSRKRDRIHAIHDFSDLSQFQVLHEVIVQNGSFDQLARPSKWKKKVARYFL